MSKNCILFILIWISATSALVAQEIQRLPGSDEAITGPSALGTFEVRPDSGSKGRFQLSYEELDMDFVIINELEGRIWTASRPDGSFRARYGLAPGGLLKLLNGQDERIALGTTSSSGIGSASAEQGAAQYRPDDPSQTWLLDFETMRIQQKGRKGVTDVAAMPMCAIQYASLVQTSLNSGPSPLFGMSLLKNDWPEPFNLIGQPAYEERAARWWAQIKMSEARKQEGEMASGNFALVSPDLGLSLAASSGWIALVSAAFSPEEGFVYQGLLPYGLSLNESLELSQKALPTYWQLLEEQGTEGSSVNSIYTTILVPGLALILTQSADPVLADRRLIGLTAVYQPYMQGVEPPRMLPPVAPEEEAAYALRTLFWNAQLDWALMSSTEGGLSKLIPAGFRGLEASAETASLMTGRMAFRAENCPGSESPVQALCAEALARRIQEGLPEDYVLLRRYEDAKGTKLSDARHRDLQSARWVIAHQEDQNLDPASYRHPQIRFGLNKKPASDKGQGTPGQAGFERSFVLELEIYPAQERF